jgi:hypothetical protein
MTSQRFERYHDNITTTSSYLAYDPASLAFRVDQFVRLGVSLSCDLANLASLTNTSEREDKAKVAALQRINHIKLRPIVKFAGTFKRFLPAASSIFPQSCSQRCKHDETGFTPREYKLIKEYTLSVYSGALMQTVRTSFSIDQG